MQHFQFTQNIFSSRFVPARIALWIILSPVIMLNLIGCATTVASTPFEPTSINEVRFRDRSLSKHDDEVLVTVADRNGKSGAVQRKFGPKGDPTNMG
jgi:hypothetical protein